MQRRNRTSRFGAVALFLVALASLPACKTIYYDTLEAFGQHKRDLLVDRVADARDDQEEAKEQFANALEKFSSLVGAPDSDLRRLYDDLNGELSRSESKAGAVHDRITAIETVGEDLFTEWERELDQYTTPTSGDRAAIPSIARAETLRLAPVVAMKRPERKMESVLVAFRDHVLYLKHNLNAQAVSSLQGTVDALEIDTAELIREMEAAIAEADSFIQTMGETDA